jgi:SpoVK/Ycf46/Vps4 family AAA+-type ATPase
MMNVADSLISKGYLKKGSRVRDEIWYTVPQRIIDCIRQDMRPTPKPVKDLTFDEFFDRLAEIMNEDDIGIRDLETGIASLLESNMHLNYCKVAESYGLKGREKVLLHIFAHRLINEDDDMIGTHDWEDYVEHKRIIKNIVRSWKSGESDLITKKIFEPYPSDNMKDPDFYHLTDQAKDELFPDLQLVEKSVKDKSLISHTSFAPKQLFYTEKVHSKIARLTELLQPDKFDQVTERLSDNGMRKGFACLFYGSPGTGKTETVNQLSRLTGRDVMVVDVTQIKSCWVGESEQNIKQLFDKYKALVKKSEVAPILLFNEADAVLGIRQEGAQRAVDKMENSIQNIILQEMETLEGIMIATTNLTCNLDKAFERRFIYKIEFERPTLEAKQQIWKAMIPSLSDAFTHSLAKEFDLSGGQIENVARKRIVELILSGEEPSEEKIREYCRGEMVNSKQEKRTKIGF